jgi:hypothetical protein
MELMMGHLLVFGTALLVRAGFASAMMVTAINDTFSSGWEWVDCYTK